MRRKKITRNVIIFGIFFIFSILGILSWSSPLFNYIGNPIWITENFIVKTFNNVDYFFETKASLSDKNKKLTEENLSINLSMLDYQILKNENSELKEMLGRIPIKHNFVLGNILTKPNHSPYDTIIIDVGINDEIKEGDLVYANGNIPIGNIAKVYDKTSLISLYTNPGQKTEGFIDGLNISVELIGRGGGNFEMIIPIELLVEKGMSIFLPGNSSEIIALVDEIISSPTDPFKKVLLISPVNIQNLKWVEVKKN